VNARPLPLNDYTLLRSVRAVCPRCFAGDPAFDPEFPTDILDGHLVERSGAVWLRRFCRRGHGEVWSLYEEDHELWSYLQQWRVPTKQINPDTAGLFPVPMGYEHALGPAHQQHSCIFLLDVTTQCNLTCPACYATSSPALSNYLPVDAVLRSVETALERENGRLDVVMLSGGEPTVHPQIGELLERLVSLPITRILVNTNGIRLANDDAFLEVVATHRRRVEVYLQYDGQDAEVHRHLRGLDLTTLKTRVLERLSRRKIFTTLVMTVDLQNAHLIGAVLAEAFATPFVGGVMFQPLFASGRAPLLDPLRRVTTTGVLRRIEEQSQGNVAARDLIALPCSHPDCCSIGYFLKDKTGRFRGLAGVIGEPALRENLTAFANTIAFSDSLAQIRAALLGVMSETMTLSRPELAKHLGTLCDACGFGGLTAFVSAAFRPGGTHDFVGERVKRVTVKHFMDADTLIGERLEQCCVHVGSAGNAPVRMPFCAARLFPRVRAKALEGTVARAALTAPA
jgi:7,8-dihydro-6-hydroxymethylpterin dimethyltransferase